MSKETKEFMKVPAMLTDSIYQALADGKFDGIADLQKFVDDLFAIQPGLEGFKNIKSEITTMSPVQFDEVAATVSDAMPNTPQPDRHHIRNIMMGALSAIALGKKLGRDEVIEELKSGKVQLKDLT